MALARATCWRVKTACTASYITVVVAPFGPPRVMICTWSNSRKERMVVIMTTKISGLRNCGSVT